MNVGGVSEISALTVASLHFFVLTSKSCDEGQVTSLIKGYLNLENELYERASCYVLRAIIAVG